MVFKDKYKAATKLFKENIKAKEEDIVNQLKENPFEIIPIDDFVTIVKDPVGFVQEKFTDPEFVGMIVTTALECVPGVGPVLSSVFSMFLPENSNPKPITKEELEAELKKLKEEMLQAMDEKIEKSEQETWKLLCTTFFDGLVRRFKDLGDPINILKKRLKETGTVDSAIATDIRTGFTEVRYDAHQLSDFCRNEKITNQVIDIYMRTLFIQCSVMNRLTAQWYQFEIDQYYISGMPADPENGIQEVKSLKEKYHDNLTEGLNHICKAVFKNLILEKPDLNKEFNEKAHKLFSTNTWLYSLPVVVAPITIPKAITKMHEVSEADRNVPVHDIPDKVGPYIYRIDGCCFRPFPSTDAQNSGLRRNYKEDPLTKCKGANVDGGLQLKIKFGRVRKFKVRVCGIYSHPFADGVIINKCEYPLAKDKFPLVPPMFDGLDTYTNQFINVIDKNSGFTSTEEMTKSEITIDISVKTDIEKEASNAIEEMGIMAASSVVKFVEIIFLD